MEVAAPMTPGQPEPVVLRAPRLLDGSGGQALPDAALWLDGGRVAWVGPAAALPAGAAEADSIELPGCTLLPGLVDAHVHLVASGGPELAADIPGTEAERTLAAIANCRRQLDSGTTLVRDLGAPGGEVIALAKAIEAGTVKGPAVIAAGPAVTMTGGHIAYMGRVADGPEQMRAAVRANLALGAGCIKVVATGGVLTKGLDPRVAAYTQPELDALVDEAHRLGLRVAAHAIGEGGVATALRAGVDSVEHGMFLDQTCIELFLETGARYSATFSAPGCIIRGHTVPDWIKDRARPAAEAQAASFQAAVKAGVRVVAGTDAGTPENFHGGVGHEVVAMVEAGLDVLAGVRAATAEGADLLGDPDRGMLRPGAIADVLAVHGDALLDVTALTRPAAVFKSGRQVR
jgi:imidazolonepropionase-like amidohydrolase